MVGFSDLTSVSKENIEVMDALVGNFTLCESRCNTSTTCAGFSFRARPAFPPCPG